MKGLGNTLKDLRKQNRITLVQMSKKTGIDPATISRIENNAMTGTVESHMRMAAVLGVTLPELYEGVMKNVTASKEKLAIEKSSTFSHSGGAVSELLTSNVLTKRMIPILIKIKPDAKTETEEYSTSSERFVFVLSGALEIHVGKESRVLSEGESIYFKASQTHYFKNAAKQDSSCLSIMTPVSL